MEKNIIVENSERSLTKSKDIEIVERKGIGHPDTLADGISEAVSRELSKEYINRFDKILHHNTDKVLLIGGSANPKFGGGEITKPLYIVIGGRGTNKAGEEKIPINKIAKNTAQEYLKDNVRFLDPKKDVKINSRIGSGSVDLKGVFSKEGVPSSNDTSIGIGYAPLSKTEELVLETERMLNSPKIKEKYPSIGEDIKVMGRRENNHIDLTVAIAMVSSFIDDLDHYLNLKEEIKNLIEDYASKKTENPVEVNVNTADDSEKEIIYQTVSGTSAEQGDDGMTGRGNRVNGLISFDRPISLEAAAGKNPVNHVGKLYNILSTEIAEEISQLEGVKEVFVRTLSQIGHPIDEPKTLNIRLITEKGNKNSKIKSTAKEIAIDHLENLSKLTKRIIKGKVKTF